jgi:hypothetical protein
MSVPTQNGTIVNFVAKVQAANNRKASNFTLTMTEAINLSTELTSLLARQTKLLEDIVELQKRASQPIQLQMDGGGFK